MAQEDSSELQFDSLLFSRCVAQSPMSWVEKKEVNLPVLGVLAGWPKPPKPVFCCCWLFWPKPPPKPPNADIVLVYLWMRRVVEGSVEAVKWSRCLGSSGCDKRRASRKLVGALSRAGCREHTNWAKIGVKAKRLSVTTDGVTSSLVGRRVDGVGRAVTVRANFCAEPGLGLGDTNKRDLRWKLAAALAAIARDAHGQPVDLALGSQPPSGHSTERQRFVYSSIN